MGRYVKELFEEIKKYFLNLFEDILDFILMSLIPASLILILIALLLFGAIKIFNIDYPQIFIINEKELKCIQNGRK